MICCGRWDSQIKHATHWEPESYGLVLNYQKEVTVVKKVHELGNYGNSSDQWLITVNIKTRSAFCQYSPPTEVDLSKILVSKLTTCCKNLHKKYE
jgi:hypothetical protein